MEITKDTRVSEILREYGDIADVMKVFGVKRVARYRSARSSPGRSRSSVRRRSTAFHLAGRRPG